MLIVQDHAILKSVRTAEQMIDGQRAIIFLPLPITKPAHTVADFTILHQLRKYTTCNRKMRKSDKKQQLSICVLKLFSNKSYSLYVLTEWLFKCCFYNVLCNIGDLICWCRWTLQGWAPTSAHREWS